MSKQLTVTMEQLGAALVAWNEMAVTDLLVEHGASVES
jgi:hypothetical protein